MIPRIYLPAIARQKAVRPGFQVGLGGYLAKREYAQQIRPGFVRTGICQAWVQPENGNQYRIPEALDCDLAAISADGATAILTIAGVAPWMRPNHPNVWMAPPENTTAWVTFCARVAERYSAPPWNVRHIEIWNEPNTPDPGLSGYYYGGFVEDLAQSYASGVVYGDLFNRCRKAIKALCPRMTVHPGGLMLHSGGQHLNFIRGMISAGVIFECLDWHFYIDYNPQTDNHELAPAYLDLIYRDIAACFTRLKRAVPTMFLTETALTLSNGETVTDDFLQAQANHANLVDRWAKKNNLRGWCWYSFDGNPWKQCGAFQPDGKPRPVVARLAAL